MTGGRNLFGRAITVGIPTRVERRQQIGRLFVGVPRLFGLPIASNIFVSRLRNRLNENTD